MEWDGRRFDYLDCQGCGSRFVAPLPSTDDLKRIYCQSEYHDVHYAEGMVDQFKLALRALGRFVPVGGTLLDFGCGNGQFLIEAKAAGYAAEGIELDASARKVAARNCGCKVISLETAKRSAKRYDAIHLGDVLEHLPNPVAVMRELETILSREGVFLIEGPLEENRSLVKWVAAAVRILKASAGRSNHADAAPTHLTRTSGRSQQRFFTGALGHRTHHFQVYESGWPYALGWADIVRPVSASRAVRGIIGKVAVGLAYSANLGGLGVGNRFIAVAQPDRASS
jgi:2-polyprenyl-3-methyl-5-hydroxy-6-metoxy-1,4-benzoquinol methylase